MKALIASHTEKVFLKSGEVYITQSPTLITTVLGSCVAVTMFSPSSGFGAICHAMLPCGCVDSDDLRYVDVAISHMYQCLSEFGVHKDLVVKLFGGAHVLAIKSDTRSKRSVGEDNVARAQAVLESLQLSIDVCDVGGTRGRRLYFCTRAGDVFLRKIRSGNIIASGEQAV